MADAIERADVIVDDPFDSSGVSYFNNELVAFDQGCQTDYRFRLAVELLTSRLFSGASNHVTPEELARSALDISEELVSQGEKRGLIFGIPDNGRLSEALKRQAERVAKYQVHQQLSAQRYANEQAGVVATPAAGKMPAFGRGN